MTGLFLLSHMEGVRAAWGIRGRACRACADVRLKDVSPGRKCLEENSVSPTINEGSRKTEEEAKLHWTQQTVIESWGAHTIVHHYAKRTPPLLFTFQVCSVLLLRMALFIVTSVNHHSITSMPLIQILNDAVNLTVLYDVTHNIAESLQSS